MLLYLHHRNSKLFFHPAKFDNFKDEKISDYKTVSVAQIQKKCPQKLLIIPLDQQFSVQQVFALWN